MRELKFRAWQKEKNAMYYFKLCALDIAIMTDKSGQTPQDKGIPIMQFTGLKDKNGKEIYEGDIVRIPLFKHKERILKVKLSEYGVTFYDISVSYRWDKIPHKDKIELIGNIYEKSDFLNK